MNAVAAAARVESATALQSVADSAPQLKKSGLLLVKEGNERHLAPPQNQWERDVSRVMSMRNNRVP